MPFLFSLYRVLNYYYSAAASAAAVVSAGTTTAAATATEIDCSSGTVCGLRTGSATTGTACATGT
jgi:hypothetical protein